MPFSLIVKSEPFSGCGIVVKWVFWGCGIAKGLAPYYYHSKKKGELDFVVERGDGVTPIEVKSGKDYKRHNALSNVLADANYQVEEALVLNNENLARVGRITYLPIYMVMFMAAAGLPKRMIYRV